MATTKSNQDDSLLKGKRKQDLQEMLREVGLPVEYWLAKLKEHLGVTYAQSLKYLEEKDLKELKSQVQHSWEERALENLFDLAQSNSMSDLRIPQEQMMKKTQQTEQTLKELKGEHSTIRQRQEESVRRRKAELRKEMEIPEENWPQPEQPLSKMIESMQKQHNSTEQTLSHRQNHPDRDLIRRASGGLALKGIYKTSHQTGLIQKTEELLSVPKEFLFLSPEQGTRMETKEFTSSQTENKFTRMIEKMGFSAAISGKCEGWRFFSFEAGVDGSKHSESKETHQSSSQKTYFCSVKFSYIPLASCHFPMDQLQLSKAAFQELKNIEKLLHETSDSLRLLLLRQRTENFFYRFGSHANQGPLHLGGIYSWKATAEGFQSDQLDEVKKEAEEALDVYIRGSYNGLGGIGAAGGSGSYSNLEAKTERKCLRHLQTTLQLSQTQTGGPVEANGLVQWKAGLAASNHTWHVIDRELHLVPIWDIITNHTSDFKYPQQLSICLKNTYAALTGLTALIQDGEAFLSTWEEAREFLRYVKFWEVFDPERQLKKLINFMQDLSHKMKSYDTWINICLTDTDLQNFLVNIFNFCKKSSKYNTKFIKFQLRSLLIPHIYDVTNFPQAESIIEWIYQSEEEPEHDSISQCSQFIRTLREIQINLMEIVGKSESTEIVREAGRNAIFEIKKLYSPFLNYLEKTSQIDK